MPLLERMQCGLVNLYCQFRVRNQFRTGSVVYKTFIGKSQKQRVVGVGASVESAMDAARSEDLRRRVEASDESNKRFKAS